MLGHRFPGSWTFMAEDSCGPVVTETRLEALERRVRQAAQHPLTVCVKGQCVRTPGHAGPHRFAVKVR